MRSLNDLTLILTILLGIVIGLPAESYSRDYEKLNSENNELDEAQVLIDEGRELGLFYLDTQDKKARDRSKKNFKRAEKILKGLLKKKKACQGCMELLVETYFYQGYFKYSKNYDKCIKVSEKGMEIFPESAWISFYQGYAYYNEGDFAEASKSLNYYLILSSGNPEAEEKVKQILDHAYHEFLNGWNKQEEFYASKDSRIDVYNQQSYTFQTVFQVTPQWEMNAGNEAYNQLTAQAQIYYDPEVQNYLEDLVYKLTAKTPGPYSNYKVTVVNSPAINAVTPPGHIIIYTGLLGFAETEAQLVGVLAHELAHNHGHHAGKRFISALRTQSYIDIINNALVNEKKWIKDVASVTTLLGKDLFLKAYGRGKEKEADLYGAHIMFNAGYSPTALSEFFLKLYKHNPKQPAKFLSTHPPSSDRAIYLTDYIESFPLDREMKMDSEAFQRVRAKFATNRVIRNNRDVLPPTIKNR